VFEFDDMSWAERRICIGVDCDIEDYITPMNLPYTCGALTNIFCQSPVCEKLE